MVACAALVVTPDSSVYTPQDLARKLVGLDYGNGTAYAVLQMLEGAMPREAISTCAASANAAQRLRGLGRESSNVRQVAGSTRRRGGRDAQSPTRVLGYLRLGYLFGQEYAAAGVAVATGPRAGARVVPDNASAFPGDPHDVTIFGCSGGGDKVSHLLAMPTAVGLFHKAVIQAVPACAAERLIRAPS